MPEIYLNPPLIEALCEFRFKNEVGEEFDWTIPGAIYEKVKNKFPIKKQKKAVSINVKSENEQILTSAENLVQKQKIIFLNEEENALLQVGANIFSVNHLRPYPGWEAFKKMIFENVNIYIETAQPVSIERIGLRYINRFKSIPEDEPFNDYFNFEPNMPIDYPSNYFFVRNELNYNKENSKLLCNMGLSYNEKEDEDFIILDFDFITTHLEHTQNYKNWLEKAHSYIEEAFNSCITEKTKNIMRRG